MKNTMTRQINLSPALPLAGRPTASAAPAVQVDPGSETMLPPEVARMLKVSISYLAKARMRGDGPPYHKIGRSVRYVRAEVLAWLESRSRHSTSQV